MSLLRMKAAGIGRSARVLALLGLVALAGCGGQDEAGDPAQPAGSAAPTTARPASATPTTTLPPQPVDSVRTAFRAAYPGARSVSLIDDDCVWLGDGRRPQIAEQSATARDPRADEWLCRFLDGVQFFRLTQVRPGLGEPTDATACRQLSTEGLSTGGRMQLNRYYCVATGEYKAVLYIHLTGSATTNVADRPYEVLFAVVS